MPTLPLQSCPCHCACRDCPGAGTFDRVVSCEMIEAVGHEHLVSFFQCIGRQLKQGGMAVIQVTLGYLLFIMGCQTSDDSLRLSN